MRRRALRILAVVLAIGIVVTAVIALGSAMLLDLATLPETTSGTSIVDDDVIWSVHFHRAATGLRIESNRKRGADWTATQATGAPDTPTQGDFTTAWASATPDGQAEWLELTYDPPVRAPVVLHVYESYNPCAIVRITLYPPNAGNDANGFVAWSGPGVADLRASHLVPVPTVDRVMQISQPSPAVVGRVRLDIDSRAVPGWNEIDAVALEDASRKIQWAKRARASSSYGQRRLGDVTTPGAAEIVPRWADVAAPAGPFARAAMRTSNVVSSNTGAGRCRRCARRDVAGRSSPVLPFRPVPFGFTIDTLAFAAAAGLIGFLLRWPARFVIESNRLRRGCCLRCGYDLQYNLVAGCPECGWRR